MALETNELYAETTRDEGPQIRPYDAGVERVTLSGGTAEELAVGTAMARNSSTGFWVPAVFGGANETAIIRAFVYPRPIQRNAGSGEQIESLMLRGEVLAADVPLHGNSQANMDTMLKAIYVTNDITNLDVRGLDGAK